MRKVEQAITGTCDGERQSAQRDRDKGIVPEKGNLRGIWDRAGVEVQSGRCAREVVSSIQSGTCSLINPVPLAEQP